MASVCMAMAIGQQPSFNTSATTAVNGIQIIHWGAKSNSVAHPTSPPARKEPVIEDMTYA